MAAATNPRLLVELLETMLLSKNFVVSEVKLPKNKNLISKWTKRYLKAKLDNNEALWHTFSFNHYTHYSKENAIEKFEHSYLKEFVIFSNNEYHALSCTSWYHSHLTFNELKQAINQSPNLLDIFISHKNFNWTFVIPHEPNFGPYFAEALY